MFDKNMTTREKLLEIGAEPFYIGIKLKNAKTGETFDAAINVVMPFKLSSYDNKRNVLVGDYYDLDLNPIDGIFIPVELDEYVDSWEIVNALQYFVDNSKQVRHARIKLRDHNKKAIEKAKPEIRRVLDENIKNNSPQVSLAFLILERQK